jgi:hypothetical protein
MYPQTNAKLSVTESVTIQTTAETAARPAATKIASIVTFTVRKIQAKLSFSDLREI